MTPATQKAIEALRNAEHDFRELLEWARVERAPLRDTECREIRKRAGECRAALSDLEAEQAAASVDGAPAEDLKRCEECAQCPKCCKCETGAFEDGVPYCDCGWEDVEAAPHEQERECQRGTAESKTAVLELCIVEREQVFVCGARGWVTADLIEGVEGELQEPDQVAALLQGIPSSTATVWVTATWIEPEYDESDGGHRMAIPGYWDLNAIPEPVPLGEIKEALNSTETKHAENK